MIRYKNNFFLFVPELLQFQSDGTIVLKYNDLGIKFKLQNQAPKISEKLTILFTINLF